MNKKGEVLLQFRNKWLNTKEVGNFEVTGGIDEAEGLLDEFVISGLAVLVQVQSLHLAMMILIGSA